MKYCLCGLLLVAAAGCGGSETEVKAITPELSQQIAVEDIAVNQEEGGEGAVRD